jgi:gamma-glutamyltranspeptidase/glutathione hydrolase
MLRMTAVCAAALATVIPPGRAAQQLPPEMEARTGKPLPAAIETSLARSDFGMVATGSPEATEIGVQILEYGGNAIDAAVAAALMLGVADPDASGIGGMTSMVIHLADGRTFVINGTAPTPHAVNPDRLRVLEKADKLVGYELAAVPTTLAVLDYARARYGTMAMANLLTPSIVAAVRGYRLSPIQIVWTNVYYERILRSGYLRLIALGDTTLLGRPADEDVAIGLPGDLRCRPDLARTLFEIQREGVASFYRGAIADQIEADMVANGGFIRKSDLATLRVSETYPLHTSYRGFDVYTNPPPGGGIPVVEALNILENFPSEFLAEDTIERHHTLIETFRIALADRGMQADNPNRLRPEPSPVLSKEFARQRAGMIVAGELIPDSVLVGPLDPNCAPTGESTTQVSVADRWGNVVSLTQTLGRSFGAEVATPGLGFPYNSLLENFNYDKPQCPGYLQPQAPCPNDMAPTIVLAADGTLLAALGAPSSNRIPSIIDNVIINLVDRHMGLGEAVTAPRVLYGGIRPDIQPFIEIEDPITAADVDALEAMGHEMITRYDYADPVQPRAIVVFGGVNAVGWDADDMTFIGVGDSRRWGHAGGPDVVAESPTAR